MTDYTKTTDFTSKDSLPSGDSGKIIRGAEFGTEFDNIQTAVNSKSNKENPSFTGNITVTGTVDGRDIATDGTKLDTIETSADVTDTANVTAAGALMDSEVTNLAQVKAFDSSDYATAAQGTTADNALPKTGGAMTGAITTNSTFDGRDVATDGTKLDGIEALADVTDTVNVTAAGALMDSEVTNLAEVKAFSSADYATAAQGTTADSALQNVVEDTTPQLGGDLASNGNDILFADNDKAIFGTGSDLEIYHDGSHSFIKDTGVGDLYIFASDALKIVSATGEGMATFNADGDVSLRYDNATKLATTNTGIDVTGTATMDGLTVDGNNAGLTITGPSSQLMKIATTSSLDKIAFAGGDGTVEAMRIDSNGNVGIGTAPDAATVLHVQATEPQVLISDASNPLQRFMAFDVGLAADEDTQFITVDQADGLAFGEKLNGNDRVIENEWMRITNAGNVGISETDPKGLLHVDGFDYSYFSSNVGSATLDNEQGLAVGWNKSAGGGETVLIANQGAGSSGGMAFATNTSAGSYNERMRIDASGNVGIGTSSPSKQLHQIRTGNASDLPTLATETGFITQSTNATASSQNISIFSGNIGEGRLFFGDTDDEDIGSIVYNHASNYLTFGTNATEAMRIDSSQNLLIGKTSAAIAGAGTAILSSGTHNVTVDGDTTLQLNRLSSPGSIATFFADGATVGSIGTRANYIKIGNGDTQLLFNSGSDAITPESSTDNRNGFIDLGRDVSQFKDLYLSGGAYLGGTGSANKLDDYEEGTWTPTLEASTTNPTGTVVVNSATYTKVGRMVHVQAYITVNVTNVGAGGAQITGLPFTVGTGYASVKFSHGSLILSNGGYFNNGSTRIIAITDHSTSSIGYSGTGAGKALMLSGIYEVA